MCAKAGSRGAVARLLELTAHPGDGTAILGCQTPQAALWIRSPDRGRSVHAGADCRLQSRVISRDGRVPAIASGFGFCAKVLVATRGLSTVGNAAEVASDLDDSTSPAVEHPPRIKFKSPDKTARHIMNVCKLSEFYIHAGTVLLHYIQ
jgi:large subunit ribosomal protein L19